MKESQLSEKVLLRECERKGASFYRCNRLAAIRAATTSSVASGKCPSDSAFLKASCTACAIPAANKRVSRLPAECIDVS